MKEAVVVDDSVQPKQCRFCTFRWVPRVKDPKQCPSCKRYGWSAATTAELRVRKNVPLSSVALVQAMAAKGETPVAIGKKLGLSPEAVISRMLREKPRVLQNVKTVYKAEIIALRAKDVPLADIAAQFNVTELAVERVLTDLRYQRTTRASLLYDAASKLHVSVINKIRDVKKNGWDSRQGPLPADIAIINAVLAHPEIIGVTIRENPKFKRRSAQAEA